MPSDQLSKIPSAADFAKRLRAIGEDMVAVARDLAAALDVNPKLIKDLVANHGVNKGFLQRLERVGRGQIHHSLVLASTPGAMRLVRVPLSEQELALKNGVEVLDEDEETIRNIPVHELTTTQAALAIDGASLRSITQQRTFIRQKKAELLPVERGLDYKVTKTHVVTNRPGNWSKELILQWLVEMK